MNTYDERKATDLRDSEPDEPRIRRCGDAHDGYCPDDEDLVTCRFCGGPLVQLGVLGEVSWARCRDCGAEQGY